jgi:hypothetical protein
MFGSFRTSWTLALAAMFCASPPARAASPENPLRLAAGEELFLTEADLVGDSRSQVELQIEPVVDEVLEQPLPPVVGGDLVEPAPNPYSATTPYGHAMPDGGYVPAPHHPWLGSFRNRPPQPQLTRESWLNRPWSASVLFGGMFLDDPASSAEGDAGFMYGLRLGWDFAPRWGVETRVAGARPGISDPTGAWDLPAAKIWMWDVNWLWYWTGDTRWRPYTSLGLGLFDADYDLPGYQHQHNTTFGLPFGVGIKYRHSTRTVMRLDLTDNVSFASGRQEGLHNLSLTAGFEARFGGGTRRNYWPWNPGRDWR